MHMAWTRRIMSQCRGRCLRLGGARLRPRAPPCTSLHAPSPCGALHALVVVASLGPKQRYMKTWTSRQTFASLSREEAADADAGSASGGVWGGPCAPVAQADTLAQHRGRLRPGSSARRLLWVSTTFGAGFGRHWPSSVGIGSNLNFVESGLIRSEEALLCLTLVVFGPDLLRLIWSGFDKSWPDDMPQNGPNPERSRLMWPAVGQMWSGIGQLGSMSTQPSPMSSVSATLADAACRAGSIISVLAHVPRGRGYSLVSWQV